MFEIFYLAAAAVAVAALIKGLAPVDHVDETKAQHCQVNLLVDCRKIGRHTRVLQANYVEYDGHRQPKVIF